MFLSKKVKQNVIITNKNGKYEFDDELQRNHSKSQKTRYSVFFPRAVLYMKS